MMWRKALLFGDEEAAQRIVAASHPRQAKMLDRRVRGFDEQIWADQRRAIVTQATVAKFGQRAELRDFLVGTGRRILVEASPTDRIWGIGLAATDERTADPARWRGLNLLGFALMAARDRFSEGPGASAGSVWWLPATGSANEPAHPPGPSDGCRRPAQRMSRRIRQVHTSSSGPAPWALRLPSCSKPRAR